MDNIAKISISGALLLLCATSALCAPPALSPHELQAAQSRDYPTDKGMVFGATLNALQDEGFTISSADATSGFISAESVSTGKTNFWDAMEMITASGNTRASIVIEGFSPLSTHMRISLISTKNLSGLSGQASREDRSITMIRPYGELYAKIDAGVTFRMGQLGKPAASYADKSSFVPIAMPSQPVSVSTTLQPGEVLNLAKAELLQEGYKIISYDEKAGFLATAPKPSHLSPNMADCGRVIGISYLKDNRAATDTQVIVEASSGSVSVRTAIDGVYRTGYGNPDKLLTCKSLGVIEADILQKLAS